MNITMNGNAKVLQKRTFFDKVPRTIFIARGVFEFLPMDELDGGG